MCMLRTFSNIMRSAPLLTSALLSLVATSASSFAPRLAVLRRPLATTTIQGLPSSSSEEDETILYDLVVIGAGPGGVRASMIASGQYGAKVAIISAQLYDHGPPNQSAIGGNYKTVGCVPRELLLYTSRWSRQVRGAWNYGYPQQEDDEFYWEYYVPDLPNLVDYVTKDIYDESVLKNAGVEIFEGFGSLDGKHKVNVKLTTAAAGEETTKTLKTKNILVATGGWPFKPDIPGIEHAITSNEIFFLENQPHHMVIVGGGYVAVELTEIMAGLNVDVTLIYRGDSFLRGFDQDVREIMTNAMRKSANMKLNTNPKEILKNKNGSLTVITEDGKNVECDQILFATGRKGKLDNLNLESAGVKTENSFITVDQYSRTNVDGIYAVGDITGRIGLTSVALMDGHRFADTLFGGMDRPVDHEFVPKTVFTYPEIGTVGYTESAAVEKFQNIDVYTTRFKGMVLDQTSFFKIIVDANTDKVVGVHIATANAGEIIQGVAIAVKMGATKADFDSTIGIHPTSAEHLVTMRTPSYRFRNGVKVEGL